MAKTEQEQNATPQDQSAMMALMATQMKSLIDENFSLKAALRPKKQGESLEEKVRLLQTIRMRTWGVDKNGAPKCLTMGEGAQMHVEFGAGNLVVITPAQCAKIYGLVLAEDDGSLMFDGKKVPGTSDKEFAHVQSGGKSLAQRTGELTRRAEVLQMRYGMKVPMPDNNDLDAWDTAISEVEMKTRSSSGNEGSGLPDFNSAPQQM